MTPDQPGCTRRNCATSSSNASPSFGCPPEDVEPSATLTGLGLGSVQILALCGDLEDELDLSIDPAVIVDYPTLESLGSFLLELQSADRGAA
ncbi:acyl carrier protein [Oerskovia sp. M15]